MTVASAAPHKQSVLCATFSDADCFLLLARIELLLRDLGSLETNEEGIAGLLAFKLGGLELAVSSRHFESRNSDIEVEGRNDSLDVGISVVSGKVYAAYNGLLQLKSRQH